MNHRMTFSNGIDAFDIAEDDNSVIKPSPPIDQQESQAKQGHWNQNAS
jgi:hypothetical protein